MATLSIPRFILSGAYGGIGKSLIGIGLAHELRRRGVSLSCCVSGPNLQQALVYRRISGRYAHSVDRKLLTPPQMLQTLYHASSGAELIMIEGTAGLYDGRPIGSLGGSDAELAALVKAPVILVTDARGFSTSLAALIKGYSEFAEGFEVAGVLLNRVTAGHGKDRSAQEAFNTFLERYQLPLLLGGVPEAEILKQDLPRGPSQVENRTSLPRQFFVDLGSLINEYVDVDGLIERAERAEPIEVELFQETPGPRRTRIAVSDDICFNLCFQDNLELLRYHGAEIVPFSPIADRGLPSKIGGVYLAGAYLNDYGAELAENQEMQDSIREFMESGGLIYSEGAGTASLCEDFKCTKDSDRLKGIGALPARAKPGNGELAFNQFVLTDDTILGEKGTQIKGINTNEFGFFEIGDVVRTLKVAAGVVSDLLSEGFSPGAQTVCTPSFLHMGSNPEVAKNLVDAAEVAYKI